MSGQTFRLLWLCRPLGEVPYLGVSQSAALVRSSSDQLLSLPVARLSLYLPCFQWKRSGHFSVHGNICHCFCLPLPPVTSQLLQVSLLLSFYNRVLVISSMGEAWPWGIHLQCWCPFFLPLSHSPSLPSSHRGLLMWQGWDFRRPSYAGFLPRPVFSIHASFFLGGYTFAFISVAYVGSSSFLPSWSASLMADTGPT